MSQRREFQYALMKEEKKRYFLGWKANLELQGKKNTYSYCFPFLCPKWVILYSKYLNWAEKSTKFTTTPSKTANICKNSTRLEKAMKKVKPLAFTLYFWRTLRGLWCGRLWPLRSGLYWWSSSSSDSSSSRSPGTPCKARVAVYLGNVKNIGLADRVPTIKKTCLFQNKYLWGSYFGVIYSAVAPLINFFLVNKPFNVGTELTWFSHLCKRQKWKFSELLESEDLLRK